MPLLAIVGRPNVGKSLLFNKLAGRRISIVEDTPGVTRDRVMASCEWSGHTFDLVDTGGIEPHTDNEILLFMRTQAQVAIEQADAVVFVCDIQTGVTAADQDVAAMLLRSRKPVVLAVNKCDRVGPAPPELYEFYNLGLGDPYPVSALHGLGTGDLLDACLPYLNEGWDASFDPECIHVAIIGKPNVGKSSLLNKVLGEERVIVSDIPGTTRDAIDESVANEHGRFRLIDTAGMRKKARVDGRIEHYSVLRSVMAIERADVCLILIDAREGVTEQDTKVAGLAHEAGKACVIVANKWDLVEKDHKTMDISRERIREALPFMAYAPVMFISAKTGQRVDKLFAWIALAHKRSLTRISTGMLNEVLADATARMQPPSDKGRRLKVFYMTQASVKPPTFVAFVNDPELFHFSYRRYLENRIREAFSLEGTPVRMVVRGRGEDGDSK